ncbi:MAG: FAD:protein FMN transferase [Zoogloeaceae bacterium]|nr:FAD:protein FMN transferase [Zoogloeaceae bacterium]
MVNSFAAGKVRWTLGLALILALAGCQRAQVFQQESFVFGTRVEVAVYGDSDAQARAALGAVLREFDRLHRAYHAWEPSELTALNDALAGGRPATVSPELAAMLRDAQLLAATGDGLFDPAVGRLVALWGFHTDTFVPRLPDAEALGALIQLKPSMADITIDGNTVTSRNPAVEIDLGGYAKGFALDRAAEILRQQGVGNALINIGGNVMALGSKGGQPWRVGIQHPRAAQALAALPLYDGEAIGTSGDYQRYFEVDGVRYAHLIDPRTGRPATGTEAVTVLVTARPHAGTLSDVASKPAYLGGPRWREYLARYGIDTALRVDGEGRVQVTRALRSRLQVLGDGHVDQVVE